MCPCHTDVWKQLYENGVHIRRANRVAASAVQYLKSILVPTVWLSVFSVFLRAGIVVLIAAFALAEGALCASRQLHESVLCNGLRSPMSFYDSTPTGRIMNRFSKDIEVIDTMIPRNLDSWMKCTLHVFGSLFVISFSTPLFLAIVLPLGVFYYLVQVNNI